MSEQIDVKWLEYWARYNSLGGSAESVVKAATAAWRAKRKPEPDEAERFAEKFYDAISSPGVEWSNLWEETHVNWTAAMRSLLPEIRAGWCKVPSPPTSAA